MPNEGKLTDTFVARIKPETVVARTGRTWDDWDDILDRWDVAERGSAASSRHLREEYGLSMWWSNTIVSRHRQLRRLT